jgi:hypothetical protein
MIYLHHHVNYYFYFCANNFSLNYSHLCALLNLIKFLLFLLIFLLVFKNLDVDPSVYPDFVQYQSSNYRLFRPSENQGLFIKCKSL